MPKSLVPLETLFLFRFPLTPLAAGTRRLQFPKINLRCLYLEFVYAFKSNRNLKRVMYGRSGLERFKKAQTLEPFAVANSASKTTTTQPPSKALSHTSQLHSHSDIPNQQQVSHNPANKDGGTVPQQVTQVGGGQSSWQPPDWAIEPRPGVYYLDVLKDGEVLDRINLDKKRHIFGRQLHTCDFVLDHQSVSRQHAAVVPHKNGSVYVIDLGSAHGTFVANERLTKESPVELEVGQSLRFAASTRVYILKKDNAALFPPPLPTAINVPPPPDPSDEEAILAYNTFLNRYNISKSTEICSSVGGNHERGRPSKRIKKVRVGFRDQMGGELVEVVGVSDGADVETEPGPIGVKEGSSLVGKYESLVQTTVIPRGKELKEVSVSTKGVTDKLQQVLNRVKAPPITKGGIYDDLYGESLSRKAGSTSSWAYSGPRDRDMDTLPAKHDDDQTKSPAVGGGAITVVSEESKLDSDDDLFG